MESESPDLVEVGGGADSRPVPKTTILKSSLLIILRCYGGSMIECEAVGLVSIKILSIFILFIFFIPVS